MIVAEHPSESLAPNHRVVKFADGGDGLQQPVAESLMISLAVIMAEVLCNSAPKRCPSKEDYPTQALFLYASDESYSELCGGFGIDSSDLRAQSVVSS
jgi:hypothetical protein